MLYLTICTMMDSGELQYTNVIYVNILNAYSGQISGQSKRIESANVGLYVQYE